MTKILLVEDDKSLREIYGVRLLAEGYDIVSAGDGEEALAMAIKERPQLILSDVMMPKISGFDMLDILRSTSETKTIKVIMMTALSSEDQRQRGEQLGADRYLVKSQVGIEDVVRTVHEVLSDTQAAAPAGSPSPAPDAEQSPQVATAAAPQPPSEPATSAPQPAPAAAVPATPAQSAPASAPTPEPAAAPEQSTRLPQPTAPFSTARPAGLADRIIQPIERPESDDEPLTSLMDRELNQQAAPQPFTPPPAAPSVPPAPTAGATMQPPTPTTGIPTESVQPPVPAAPQPSETLQSPADPAGTYEETPRQ